MRCKQERMGVQFEYTIPGTPQQNGQGEQKFATLFNRICEMLNSGKFSSVLRNSLWAKAANATIFLENHIVTPA